MKNIDDPDFDLHTEYPSDKEEWIGFCAPVRRPRKMLFVSDDKDPGRVVWVPLPDPYASRAVAREEWLASRLRHAVKELGECMEVTPTKRGRIPVVKGTRFTVAQVLAEL